MTVEAVQAIAEGRHTARLRWVLAGQVSVDEAIRSTHRFGTGHGRRTRE